MKFGVVRFPGSNCDQDAYHVLRDVMDVPVEYVWHETGSLRGFDCVVLPGGFSYGDYLRCGSIARFSPVMEAVRGHAERGRLVLGICNGFQILCESHLLPGALVRNRNRKFICRDIRLCAENLNTPFTRAIKKNQVLRMPIAHGEGCYVADADTLAELTAGRRILFRYCDDQGRTSPDSNPNGSLNNIAGIANTGFNVMGLMPHPERAAESLLGSVDGRVIFESLVRALKAA